MKHKNVIVTPNYLNRKNPLRWMIKKQTSGLPTCYDKLVLKGPVKTRKTGGEGFGCSIGILAKEVTDSFDVSTLHGYTRLCFDGYYNFQKLSFSRTVVSTVKFNPLRFSQV